MYREGVIKRKKSLIHSEDYMNPNEKICLPISLILGIYNKLGAIFPPVHKKRNFLRFRNNIRAEAFKLCNDAGLDLNGMESLAGFEEFNKFQSLLLNFKLTIRGCLDDVNLAACLNQKIHCFRIIIYDVSSKPIFLGFVPDGSSKIIDIHLLLHEHHFRYIRSLPGAFAVSHFCEYCHVGYALTKTHLNCPYTCNQCFSRPPCRLTTNETVAEVPCLVCNRVFLNPMCYNQHIIRKVCEKIRFCIQCNRVQRKGHDCRLFYCTQCNSHQEYDHNCLMPTYTPKIFKGSHCYVYFDFESMLEKRDEFSGDFHVVNLCVSNVTCEACVDAEANEINCGSCGERRKVFFYDPSDKNSVVDAFLSYLFQLAVKFNNVTVISHNGGKYDNLFIAKRLFATQADVIPSVVMRGLKIYMLKFKRLRFIDSYNFSCCALSKLPKMYDLGVCSKGFFPHLFNRAENSRYIGCYPDKSMYDPGAMSTETLAEFNAWYETVKHLKFDFQNELVKYCSMDVTILRLFCTKLTKLMLEDTGIDIFRESLTIASFVSKRFRKDFYKSDISLIPLNGYRLRDNQSVIALKYIAYLEKHVYNAEIRSALRTGEKTVVCGSNRYKVDGYIEQADDNGNVSKIVIEFFGCHYHGHYCQNNFLATVGTDRWARDRLLQTINRETTQKRVADLKACNFIVNEMWECQFREFLKNNLEIAQEVEWVSKNKLDPRDSFFGGRTECFKTFYKCKPGEEIRYYDVCSLYPYVNKFCKNVVGVPKVVVGPACNDIDLATVDGLIKLRVYPPTRLYHPILPLRLHNKLLFPLCYQCASESFDGDCIHSEQQRSWVGTYVADELRVAISYGYRTGEIFEIWVYETVVGLFEDYIKHYQREKLYASGWPVGYDDSTIDEFIHAYKEREGVELDKTKFEDNPAKRNFAKMMNNSLWGRMGMNIRTSTRILTDAGEFNKMMTDSATVIQGFKIMNEKTLLVSYDNLNATPPNTSNVVVASMTTAMARLELNKMLQKCGKSALYGDTDCTFFVQKTSEKPLLETGPFLGDLTNELEKYGPNSYIDVFVSAGPKSYGYEVVNTNKDVNETIVKVKGINLNTRNQETINFASLCNQIINEQEAPALTVNNTLFVKENDFTIHSVQRKKDFRVVVDKRRRIGFHTYPYGYLLDDSERQEAWLDYNEIKNTPINPTQIPTTVQHASETFEDVFSQDL